MTTVIGVKPQSWPTLGSNTESTTRNGHVADELMLCCPAHLSVKDSTNEQPSKNFYNYKNVFVLN